MGCVIVQIVCELLPSQRRVLLREINLCFGFDDRENCFGGVGAGFEFPPGFFQGLSGDGEDNLALVGTHEKVLPLAVHEF